MSKYYTSAREISFELFQKVCVEADLSPLIIRGNPGLTELNNAWVDIYTEYTDAIGNSTSFHVVEKTETEVLRSKILVVRLLVKSLSLYPEESMIKTLKGFGYNYKFDFSDNESYLKDLRKVIARSEFWVMKLNEKSTDLKSSEVGQMPTYADFSKCVFAVSKYAGFEIKASKISALDFAIRYKNMVEYYKHQNNKNGK